MGRGRRWEPSRDPRPAGAQHRSGRASRRRIQGSHCCVVPVHVELPAWCQPSMSRHDVSVSEAHLRPQGAGTKEEDTNPKLVWVGELWLSAAWRFNVFPKSPEREHLISRLAPQRRSLAEHEHTPHGASRAWASPGHLACPPSLSFLVYGLGTKQRPPKILAGSVVKHR